MSDIPAVSIGPGIALPPMLLRRWMAMQGRSAVEQWLQKFPAHLDRLCRHWAIEILPEVPPLSYNIVLFGISRQVGEVVVKFSLPTPEAIAEISALRLVTGSGGVRVYEADPDVSYIIQSRIRPGTMLDDEALSDEDATAIGVDMMRKWWLPNHRHHHLIRLEHWARELLDYSPIHYPDAPHDLIALGQEIGRRLLASPHRVGVLHGDIHHQNILRDDRNGWVLIDPKGLVGEAGFEVGTWMMNPWGFPARPDFLELAPRRLDILADCLEENRQRLVEWSVFFATLSLCWALADAQPEDLGRDILFAERMTQLL